MTEGRVSKPDRWIVVVGVALVLAVIFFSLAATRTVDQDEGFSIVGAAMALDGKVPYRDFFYQQMPLPLYVYGAWMKVLGETWLSARFLSALFAVVLGLLVFFHARRATGRRSLALLAAGLFAFSSAAGGWYTVVKTHGLASLLLFGSYCAVAGPGRSRNLLGGILLGLAVGVRLTFAGVGAAFGLWFLFSGEPGARLRSLVRFGAGMALGLLPSLALFAAGPGNFVFDNLTYHSLRSGAGMVGDLWQKWEVLLQLLGVKEVSLGEAGTQFALLFVVNLYLAGSAALFRRRLPLALYIAAALFVIHMLPTPTFTQYFATLVPYLIIGAVWLTGRLAEESAETPVLRRRLKLALGFGLGLYVAVWPYDYLRSVAWTRKPLPRLGNAFVGDIPNWTIPNIRRVSAAIDRVVADDSGPVLTWWPGYLVESRAEPWPGTENNWGRDISEKLTEEQRERYNIITEQEMETAIRHREPPVIVLGNWAWEPWYTPNKSRFRDIIRRNAYELADKIGDAEVYRRTWLPGAEEVNSRLLRLAQELASGLPGPVRAAFWPTVALDDKVRRQVEPLTGDVLSYEELYRRLRSDRASLDGLLPALAFWSIQSRESHPEPMQFMNDCENYLAGGLRFTLLGVDPDSITAVFYIDRADDDQ